jgi:hypothetical protein
MNVVPRLESGFGSVRLGWWKVATIPQPLFFPLVELAAPCNACGLEDTHRNNLFE